MKLEFYKYHGTGNDFILIDCRNANFSLSTRNIARLCDRNFGIGADGLMFLTLEPGYDFGMKYYNSDGKESTMCGNGGRCITAFARSLGIVKQEAIFKAIDGDHLAEILSTEHTTSMIRLKMSDVATSSSTPFKEWNGKPGIMVDTGSPHLVFITDKVRMMDVFTEGRKLRYDPGFDPEGVNVDFVEQTQAGLFVRTYERGVENETLSCGTGVTAAAIAVASRQRAPGNVQVPSRILIETPGGHLTVSYRMQDNRFIDIWLEGPAEFVFKGETIL